MCAKKFYRLWLLHTSFSTSNSPYICLSWPISCNKRASSARITYVVVVVVVAVVVVVVIDVIVVAVRVVVVGVVVIVVVVF